MPSPIYDSVVTPADPPRVRLLTLLRAASPAEPVSCQLTTVQLREINGKYEALSYCWGSSDRDRYSVRCNGHPLGVTQNLDAALRHLRRVDEDRNLWIDAICINQSDIDERSQQVKLMKEIYEHASRVIVWLGPESSESSLAFTVLDRLASHWDEFVQMWNKDKTSVMRFGSLQKFIKQMNGRQLSRPASSSQDPLPEKFNLRLDEMRAVRAITERPWWTRIWVVQEICLAKKADVQCGDLSMPWDRLQQGIVVAFSAGGVLQWLGMPSFVVCTAYIIRLSSRMRGLLLAGKRIGLGELHSETSSFAATVPHDKILSLLGLLSKTSGSAKYAIEPDYSKNPRACYQQATLVILEQDGMLDVLERCGDLRLSGPRPDDLPSWVPDFSANLFSDGSSNTWGPASPFARAIALATLANIFAQERVFAASGTSSNHSEFHFLEPSSLRLSGHKIDTITTLGKQLIGELAFDNDALWRFYGEEHDALSFPQSLTLFIHQCLRAGSFCEVLRQWESIAFADSRNAVPEERQRYLRTLMQGSVFRDIDASITMYERDWRPLFNRARFLWPLRVFGTAAPGTFSLYNFAVGFATYMSVSGFGLGTQSHLVTLLKASGLRMGKTAQGKLGLFPSRARLGDSIALLKGGKRPFVIRPARDHSRWEIVGGCYVDEIMNGEGWRENACNDMIFD